MEGSKKKGKIVIISGFSGVGKGTVVKELMKNFDHYALSVSMTTRNPRDGEEHGVNYYFVTNEVFEKMIKEDGFLEHAGYVDHYYGTPRAFVEENIANGTDVILEIEVQGAMQIKKDHPESVLIFVTTPSAREMARRLIGRKTETKEQILGRFKKAVIEADEMKQYDYIVINDDLDECVQELNRIVETEKGGVKYDPSFKEKFKSELAEITVQFAKGILEFVLEAEGEK